MKNELLLLNYDLESCLELENDLAENSFAYVGTLDEAIEKDKKAVA